MLTIDDIVRSAAKAGYGARYGHYVHDHDPPKQKQPKRKRSEPTPPKEKELPKYRTCLHAKHIEDLRLHNIAVHPSCPHKERDRTQPIDKQFTVNRLRCSECDHYQKDISKLF